MDEDSLITIDYLSRLPPGGVVHWASHHVSSDQPWTSRWVDVRIVDRGAPPMEWVWTIIGVDDPEGTTLEQLWQFVWPYDLDVHEVREPIRPPRVFSELVGSWVAARGEDAPRGVATALREVPERGKRTHLIFGGWSAQTIGQAISHWAAEHAGRPDLRFEWDPEGEPPPTVIEAAERARRIDTGEPVWDLGDGLTVADGLMDELLAMDPVVLRASMEVLRDAKIRICGDRERSFSDDSSGFPI